MLQVRPGPLHYRARGRCLSPKMQHFGGAQRIGHMQCHALRNARTVGMSESRPPRLPASQSHQDRQVVPRRYWSLVVCDAPAACIAESALIATR